jgi:hypothetical protein
VLTGHLPPAEAGAASRLSLWLLREGEDRPRQRADVRLEADGRARTSLPLEAFAELAPRDRVLLAVGDGDGLALGIAELRAGEVGERPLALELAHTAAVDLEVEFEQPAGLPPAGTCDGLVYQRLSLRAPGPLGLGAAWRERSLKWLPPGDYELGIGTREHREEVVAFELSAGRATPVSAALALEAETRTVHGRIRTESGKPLARGSVLLRLEDEPATSWSATYARIPWCAGLDHRIVRDEDEPSTGTFTFARVPRGPVGLEFASERTPASIRVRERADGDLVLDVVQLDGDGPGLGFRIEFADPELAGRAWIHTRALDGGPELFRYAQSGRTIAREAPTERRLEWAVVAKGCRTVFGTQDDFFPAGDGRYFATVRMEPGFALRVRVLGPGGRPLVGAEVHVDGEWAGETNALGTLELSRPTAPTRIEARYSDWRAPSGFPPLETNGYLGGAWHEIRLAPGGSG